MNNIVQVLNDPEEAMRQAFDAFQYGMWTAIPGIIENVDFDEMTVSVCPSIKYTYTDLTTNEIKSDELPLLIHVPIVFPSGGGFLITLPLGIGDEVLVVFSSRCMDAWWQNGGIQNPMETRMHDLSDGFAIPGPRSIPNVAENISSSKLQIRNDAGDVVFSLGSKFGMKNSTTDLKTLLSELNSTLTTFMTVLASFGGGTAPTTQAMLQSPAATAETSLGLVTAAITALLEIP